MSNKALILSMYLVALFIILHNYYTKQGNSGMPKPDVITAPSYLYAVLGLTSDFTGGLSTVLAVGLTLGLYYRTHNQQGTSKPNTGVKVKPHTVPYTVPAPKSPGVNK